MTKLIKGWHTFTPNADPRAVVYVADPRMARADVQRLIDRVKAGPQSDDDREWQEAVEKIGELALGRAK